MKAPSCLLDFACRLPFSEIERRNKKGVKGQLETILFIANYLKTIAIIIRLRKPCVDSLR